RRKAALRAQAKLVERDVPGRLVDPPLDVVFFLKRTGLRGHEAEHHVLVALRDEAQRLEPAGALGVVFEEIAVISDAAEQDFGDRLVAAFRYPGRAEIAAAHMG